MQTRRPGPTVATLPQTARRSRPPRQTGRPPVWRGSLPAGARRAGATTMRAARTTPITKKIACVCWRNPTPTASRPAAKPMPSRPEPACRRGPAEPRSGTAAGRWPRPGHGTRSARPQI